MKIKIREADRIYSLYLRKKRGHCERCYKNQSLQISHYFGRAAESVRFDEENTDVLCFSCHQYFTANPHEYREWKEKKLGKEGIKKLIQRWVIMGKRDDKAVIIVYEKLLKEME